MLINLNQHISIQIWQDTIKTNLSKIKFCMYKNWNIFQIVAIIFSICWFVLGILDATEEDCKTFFNKTELNDAKTDFHNNDNTNCTNYFYLTSLGIWTSLFVSCFLC